MRNNLDDDEITRSQFVQALLILLIFIVCFIIDFRFGLFSVVIEHIVEKITNYDFK